MEYKRFDKDIVVRIDKGEEILEKNKRSSNKRKYKISNSNSIGSHKRIYSRSI